MRKAALYNQVPPLEASPSNEAKTPHKGSLSVPPQHPQTQLPAALRRAIRSLTGLKGSTGPWELGSLIRKKETTFARLSFSFISFQEPHLVLQVL